MNATQESQPAGSFWMTPSGITWGSFLLNVVLMNTKIVIGLLWRAAGRWWPSSPTWNHIRK